MLDVERLVLEAHPSGVGIGRAEVQSLGVADLEELYLLPCV